MQYFLLELVNCCCIITILHMKAISYLPLKVSILLLCLLVFNFSFAQDYEAARATVAPTIDGLGTDACWTNATWHSIDQTWALTTPSAADFSGRFKISWDANKLYVLGEITDDVLNDGNAAPLSNYWEDDCFEVFIDENHSGGNHQNSYNAFAYHISQFYDVADIGSDGNARLYNNHVTVQRTASGNVYTWECAFTVYTDAYNHNLTSNPIATLTAGKEMGFAMAYCDNDGGTTRQHFVGSQVITAADKNIAYITADVFGKLTLVETLSPTFSHVLVDDGLANPTVMVCAPDGRIFVCEQTGALKVIKNGVLLGTPVVTVPADNSGGAWSERGLIGMALHPQFASNNYIYLYYTTTSGGTHNRVSRFTLSGDVVVPGSEVIILDLDPLSSASNHNGGAMHFGPDGKLYIATGENATPANSQNLTNYHGKLLRVNDDGSVPADNPFAGAATEQQKRIWSYGLRNPFTFDVQPGTGKIYLNDVGQDAVEEINDATTGGKNFGWPTAEGNSSNPAFTNPVYTYQHTTTDSTGCAITGGTFFNPSSTNYPPQFIGKYFFMDYCNNWINYVDPANGFKRKTLSSSVAAAPVAIDVGSDGNLYYLSRGTGSVYKIVFTGSIFPTILEHPKDITVFESQPATFTVLVSGTGPMTYVWMKDGVAIPNSNSATYTIPSVVPGDAGGYSVTVTNSAGSVTSNIGTLTVGPFNSKPTATITSPVTGDFYSGGDVITFSGTGSDPEDGVLPPSAFKWFVNFHHDTHVHDGTPITGITNGTFTIPVTGETAANVWFRIKLVVTDALGLTDTTFVEIFPRKATLTFQTVPAGLQVKIDGQPKTTTLAIQSVHNVQRTIGPVTPQFINGVPYVFSGWSHGGEVGQIIAPSSNTTYIANYRIMNQDTVRFSTIHDAYVQYEDYNPVGASANTTFGVTDVQNLISKSLTAGNNRNIYLMFNIAGFTDSILTAKLRLYGSIESGTTPTATSVNVGVFSSTNTSWTETTITWNNKSAVSASGIDTIAVTGYTGGYFDWDVAQYIRQERSAGRTTLTLVLRNTQESFPRLIFNSGENVNGKGPELILTSPDYPLGVELVEFKTQVNENNVKLLWTTSHEKNNDYFVVQRSTNGASFDDVGIVNGMLNSNTLVSYNYTDNSLPADVYYYRLKQVDVDGTSTYSEIITAEVDFVNLVISPNPIQQRGEILFDLDGEATLIIYDLLGQEVRRTVITKDTKFIDKENLTGGIYSYIILIENSHRAYSGKIIFVD